tara:strand:- start:550 stop:681 length:132 start_codon:yes stop_codon:yes gene_type:complete
MKSMDADTVVQIDRSTLAKSNGTCFNLAVFYPLEMIKKANDSQ